MEGKITGYRSNQKRGNAKKNTVTGAGVHPIKCLYGFKFLGLNKYIYCAEIDYRKKTTRWCFPGVGSRTDNKVTELPAIKSMFMKCAPYLFGTGHFYCECTFTYGGSTYVALCTNTGYNNARIELFHSYHQGAKPLEDGEYIATFRDTKKLHTCLAAAISNSRKKK